MSQSRSRQSRHRPLNRRPLCRLENLEPRTLFSTTISTYAMPSGFETLAATYDDADTLWVAGTDLFAGTTSLAKVVNNNLVSSVALPDPGFGAAPGYILAGHNGHIYVTDAAGQIDDFNTATNTFATYTWDPGANSDFSPRAATITADNAVWFVTAGTINQTFDGLGNQLTDQRTSYIGRLDPTTHAVSFTTINDFDPTVSDSQAILISAHGTDGVYVGMGVLDDAQLVNNQILFGENRIVAASFNGSSVQVDHVYTMNTGDATADDFSYLTGVATDPTDGSVWFSLANSNQPSLRPATPADRIVHGVVNGLNLDQTAYILPDATNTNPLAVSNLAMDDHGRLFFNELLGTQMGYFNTITDQYAPLPLLTYPGEVGVGNGGFVSSITAGHNNNEATMVVFDDTPGDGSPLVKVNIDEGTTASFTDFTATLLGSHAEDTAQTLNVSFTATAPVSGSYSVLVNWGDGSAAQSGTAALVAGQYVLSLNHTFTTPGTYPVTVTVSDGTTVPTHTLTINPVITDTPLVLQSFGVNNLAARVAMANLVFTDDIDAKASQFSVTINWGDGTTSRGLVIRDPSRPGQFRVIAIHVFARRGTYTVSAAITTSEVNAVITSNTASTSVTVG